MSQPASHLAFASRPANAAAGACLALAVALGLALSPTAAWAEEASPQPAAASTAVRSPGAEVVRPDAASRVEGGQRVRASHRVDVIAPGEKVESVIDRMRAQRPATSPSPRESASTTRPVERGAIRSDGDAPRGGGPAGGPGQGPGPGQGMGPGVGAGPGGAQGGMPPPDRRPR